MEAINKFRENNDNITISLNRFDFEGCVNALMTGAIDVSFGLESTFIRYSEIKDDILHDYDICLICAHSHPFAKMKKVSIGEGVAIAARSVVRENEVKAILIEETHHSSSYVIAYLDKKKKRNFDKFVKSVKDYFATL